MKRLLCLLVLAAATLPTAQAAPVVAGYASVHGGFAYSGGPQNSSGSPSAATAKPGPTTGFPSGPAFPVNNGPRCVTTPVCTTPYISFTPGCVGTAYTNYQVISPSVVYYTDSSSYYYAPSPTVAPAAPIIPTLPVAIVDGQGYIQSPYSKSVLKMTHPVNGQTVHDPINGKPFLVQIAGAARVTAPIRQID